MKKIIAFVLLAITFTAMNTFSQGFTFTRIGPETKTITDTSDYEGVIYGVLKPTTGTITIRMVRTLENLTSSWQPLGTAICNYVSCYPPEVDTVIAGYGPGITDDTVSFHFYCRDYNTNTFVHGAGHIKIRAELVSNPTQFIELDFRANTTQTIGITQISSIVKDFSLNQNYPNPFNPTTNINFSIPKNEYVSLRVFDMLGREVKALVSQDLTQGEYQVNFDATGLSSGMYYYSLRAGDYVSVKKMVLVK